MRIRQQQIFLLLITSVFLTSTLSLLIYKTQKETIIDTIYKQLESVSRDKESRINGILKSRFEMVLFPANNKWLKDNLIAFNTSENPVYLYAIQNILSRYIYKIPSFKNMYILNTKGIVIASTDSANINQNWSKQDRYILPLNGKMHMENFHYVNKDMRVFLSAPIYYKQKIIGVVVVERDAADILSIVLDYASLGETGETLLAKNQSNKIIYLTPLRHYITPGVRHLIHTNEISTSRILNEKKHLLIKAKDYRGIDVLVSARYIQELDWGLVTKIDFKEVMKPVHNLRNMLLFFNLGAILLAFLIAYFAGTQFVKPIEELIESTNRVKWGDLSKRAKVTTRNEIGILATSFNKMTDRLQQKAEQMENYAYIISHDLKAPLASIESLLTILKEEYKDKAFDSEGKEMMEMIDVKIQAMKRLIEDVLKTAKEESKTIEQVNLADLCQEILENLNPPPHYHIFIQKTLPVVMYHKISLLQILQNLISNSIKYMDKDQPLIKIGCIEYDRYYQVCVTDNGAGISKDKQSKIFEIFEVAHDEEKKDSHGIGLSIVKQLVEEHGGKVWVESEEGKETSFYFSIPK